MSIKATYPKLYSAWVNMKQRCYNSTCREYPWYGAKGIQVCVEWRDSAKAFIDWALSAGWQEGLYIDRIDPTKGYEPANCRWVTRSFSCSHVRHKITRLADGTSLKEYCLEHGLKLSTIQKRMSWLGLTADEAINYKGPRCK